jgi:hypothetical protein
MGPDVDQVPLGADKISRLTLGQSVDPFLLPVIGILQTALIAHPLPTSGGDYWGGIVAIAALTSGEGWCIIAHRSHLLGEEGMRVPGCCQHARFTLKQGPKGRNQLPCLWGPVPFGRLRSDLMYIVY